MKQALTVDQKGFQWHTVHKEFRQTIAQKPEISTKSMFTATELPTDMLGYSVGVVRQ
jgi:hypothetical protein